ncbi:HAD domain-containing protein [Catenulispora subtropica]|uniref:HAD domain-containing protein n=1 Tax=Catenulispora subtropica TaxID=450798 RepID=UPI0031DA596C
MTSSAACRPLLFLDVDGPLNPFAIHLEALPAEYQVHEMRPDLWADPMLQPLRVCLNPAHGARLLALPAELVWATSWEHDANSWIAPRLGLPELPVVGWPEDLNAHAPADLCWKTPTLLEYAAGRPFAFIDDDITDADRLYAEARCEAPMLFHHVDPAKGLTDADFAVLAEWLGAL